MDANSRAEYIIRIREEERARIRREEVEPLREALASIISADLRSFINLDVGPGGTLERCVRALRAADERGK